MVFQLIGNDVIYTRQNYISISIQTRKLMKVYMVLDSIEQGFSTFSHWKPLE